MNPIGIIWSCIKITLLLLIIVALLFVPVFMITWVVSLHWTRAQVDPLIWDTALVLAGLYVPTLRCYGTPGFLPDGSEEAFMPDITSDVRERAWGLLPSGVVRWRSLISWAAAKHGLDELMLATIVTIENPSGDPTARGADGEYGLGQVMPYHFGPDQNPEDSATNLDVAGRILKACMDLSGGRFRLAAACYNGGQGAITNPGRFWTSIVEIYFQRSKIFSEILAGVTTTLDNWLGNYPRGIDVPSGPDESGLPTDPTDPDGLRCEICLEPAKKGWRKWVARVMDLLGLGPYYRCKPAENPTSYVPEIRSGLSFWEERRGQTC